MAKLTLLEIVQDILNDYDGDEVNSIDDTIESTQIANIVKSTYESLMTTRNWPHTRKLTRLIPSSDPLNPTHMTFDLNIKQIDFINYDKAQLSDTNKQFRPVHYKYPDEFLRFLNKNNSSDAVVDVVRDATGVDLLIRNDFSPTWYTSFDEEVIVFDSYDKALGDTLLADSTQAMVFAIPGFILTDTAIPDLPEEAFPLLVEESKSRVSIKLRQTVDAKAEAGSQKQDRWLSTQSWIVRGGIKFPNYGRGKSKGHRDPTFRRNN